jgi:rod shape-determining protein MreC
MLKRMLRFDEANNSLDVLPARVVWTEPTGLGSYIWIDKGTRDGLHEQMTVLDQNGYLVGTVVDAASNASKVLLLLSPSSSIGAIDQTTRAQGLVEGRFSAGPQFRYVVTGSLIHKRDLIVTSGQKLLYPRNLLIGQVMSVSRSPQNVFQTAEIRPAADFQHLEIVQVVRNWARHVPAKLVNQQ